MRLSGRVLKVEMQADAEERGAFFQAVRRGPFQVVSNGYLRFGFLVPGNLGFSELTFRDTLCGELSQDYNFLFINVMVENFEGPFRVESVVQTLNHGGAFNVIEYIAVETLPLFDLVGRERFF